MLSPGWILAFDSAVSGPLLAARAPALTWFFYACTLMANTGTIVFVTTAAVLVLAFRRRWAEAVLVLAVVAGGQLLGTLLKVAFVRQRPPAAEALIRLPGTYSFPSGTRWPRCSSTACSRSCSYGRCAPAERASLWLRGRCY